MNAGELPLIVLESRETRCGYSFMPVDEVRQSFLQIPVEGLFKLFWEVPEKMGRNLHELWRTRRYGEIMALGPLTTLFNQFWIIPELKYFLPFSNQSSDFK